MTKPTKPKPPHQTNQSNPKLLVKAVNAWVRSAFGNVYLILFSQLQMDCAKFDISLEEESWIGKKSPPSFAFIIAKKLMLYHLNHFISSETWLSYYKEIAPLSTISHDSCLSEHRQCCNTYRCSSLWLSATQARTEGAIN